MTQRILKYGGIGPLSRAESDRAEAEPDKDPRGDKGTEIVSGMHLMSAVQQLEPCATTGMAYFDPDSGLADATAAEIQEAVRSGEVDLTDHLTVTDRFTPLVDPRRSRRKRRGELTLEGDADLWHVPTDSWVERSPRDYFEPLAAAISDNDDIPDDSVFGEFRERRNGGEVFGEVVFDGMEVNPADSDPVRMGFQVGWSYFGDRSFFVEPFAQATRCKNSVRAVGDKEVVMNHNQSVNLREMWNEKIRELGIYGDKVAQAIEEACEILYDFSGELAVETVGEDGTTTGEDDEALPDGVVTMPMSLEAFYEHAGFPGEASRIAAEHAREAARNSGDPREEASRVNAWHIHSGATFWLKWHWNGAEDSRTFKKRRRAADDMLFNPYQIADRVEDEYRDEARRTIIRDVLGPEGSLADADEEEIEEIEDRLANHEGVVRMAESVSALGDKVEQFEDTEDRLDRMEDAIASAGD